ncbi:MAG TPA: hypothetical protein PK052_11900, partial [Anaerohalosphaeraceae bacterium]|nr:hypothetical protein [Anaerohalosphaeraceae bacterium]
CTYEATTLTSLNYACVWSNSPSSTASSPPPGRLGPSPKPSASGWTATGRNVWPARRNSCH